MPVVPFIPAPEASSSVVAPPVPYIPTPRATSSVVVPNVDPGESIGLYEADEETQEGALYEDADFDVVENITSDVYQ